jgi:hypothetical protein
MYKSWWCILTGIGLKHVQVLVVVVQTNRRRLEAFVSGGGGIY